MKLIHSITLALCLFSMVLRAQTKPLPDSIRLEFPEYQSLILFELREYEANKVIIKNFPRQLGEWVNTMERSLTSSDKSKLQQAEVTYTEDEEGAETYTLQIQPNTNASTEVTVREHSVVELLPPGWVIHMTMKSASIHVYAPNLERLRDLMNVNLEPVLSQLDNDPETQNGKRFGLIARVIINEGAVQHSHVSHRESRDMLGLHPGAGIGLVRERFYPEFNFTTSFYLANRYKENHQRISAHYELKFFTNRSTEGAYRSAPSAFVSVSYALNFRKDRAHWTGLGVGWMVYNRSDVFTGKTLKLFFESDIGSPKLNILPELYLTNDLKHSVFGLKLNYKF